MKVDDKYDLGMLKATTSATGAIERVLTAEEVLNWNT